MFVIFHSKLARMLQACFHYSGFAASPHEITIAVDDLPRSQSRLPCSHHRLHYSLFQSVSMKLVSSMTATLDSATHHRLHYSLFQSVSMKLVSSMTATLDSANESVDEADSEATTEGAKMCIQILGKGRSLPYFA
jgi:hypothetical protein